MSIDVTLSTTGWRKREEEVGQAQMWQSRNGFEDTRIILAVDCHSDPDKGYITWRRGPDGVGYIDTVPTVCTLRNA